MMLETTAGVPINAEVLRHYLKHLVNLFFKILPMRENGEESLPTYMRSLQIELLGCKGLIEAVRYDSDYLTMLSILQYLIDNPECNLQDLRREVFRAISICNKLRTKIFPKEGEDI